METWSDEYITLEAAKVAGINRRLSSIAACPSEAESLDETWQDENIGCPTEVAEKLVEGGNPPVWSGRGES